MSKHGKGNRPVRKLHTPPHDKTRVCNEHPLQLGYGVAGGHHLNLVEPICVTILATRNPLIPPPNRWRDGAIPAISSYLKEPFFLYSVIHPNDHEYIDGVVLRETLSLHRKIYLQGWLEGENIPPLIINRPILSGNDYTAWCIAQTIREGYLKVIDYHYPELNVIRNKGHLKAPEIAKLMSYKLIPPFIIYDRLQRIINGL